MTDDSTRKSVAIIPIVRKSFELYKSNFGLFVLISFLSYLGIGVMSGVPLMVKGPRPIYLTAVYPLFSLVGIVIYFLGYIVLIYVIAKREEGEEVTIRQALAAVAGRVWMVVGVGLFIGLCAGVGLLLLVAPGVYVGTVFSLALFAVVFEDKRFFGSLGRSFELIRGHFWKALLLYLIVYVMTLPMYAVHWTGLSFGWKYLVPSVYGVFYLPFSSCASVLLYNILKEMKAAPDETKPAESRWFGCLGCLGMIVLVVLFMILSAVWFAGIAGFLKTDTGKKTFHWWSATFSPKIVLPGGTSVKRPDGYWVARMEMPTTAYVLTDLYHKERPLSLVIAGGTPAQLGVPEVDLPLTGGEQIGEKLLDQFYRMRSPNIPFVTCERISEGPIELNGRTWIRYQYRVKGKYKGAQAITGVVDYTSAGPSLIFVSSGFPENQGDDVLPELRLILEGIIFK